MFDQAVKWLVDSGLLEKILDQAGKETPLTAADVRKTLDKYIERLLERLDEDRLRQLSGGLTLLKDAPRSAARTSLATQALNSFHEIAALPYGGKTGEFGNHTLRCLAFLGMAAAHQILGDPLELIAEKIARAVSADPNTAEKFLGKETNNAIYRRMTPSQFLPLGGSPKNQDVLFPQELWYFVHPNSSRYEHLWIRKDMGTYTVGLTHYSAQHLTSVTTDKTTRFPKVGTKIRQMQKCGILDHTAISGGFDQTPNLYAPLSGVVEAVNEEHKISLREDFLVQDPYDMGWLFQIRLDYAPSLFKKPNYEQEFKMLLNAEQYRALLTKNFNDEIVCVESIAYKLKGGRQRDRDLIVIISLVNQFGEPLDGATIEAKLTSNASDSPYYSDDLDEFFEFYEFSGKTGIDGKLSCELQDAISATYTMKINKVEVHGRWWMSLISVPENEFRK